VAAPVIGQAYGGGKIAYILQVGDPGYIAGETHGMIAAPADHIPGIQWWKGSDVVTGATGTALGTGFANTNLIIAAQGPTATDYAAGLARAYNAGGYTDWYLPSKDELNKLYLNRDAIGGFARASYWTSSEKGSTYYDIGTWFQDFPDGFQFGNYTGDPFRVRAVRAF